ncbi:hypothetical protein FOCC_FOCC011523, partial [Frankliniella occidentalis]
MPWHRPFCADLQESTFSTLKNFMEKFGKDFFGDQPPPPFPSSQDHHDFVYLCLKLLCSHFSLALSGGVSSFLGHSLLSDGMKSTPQSTHDLTHAQILMKTLLHNLSLN